MNDDLTLLASAYLDGDVTADERARVENDAEALAEVDRLRSVRALLGDVGPQAISVREAHLATALEVWDRLPERERAGVTAPTPLSSRRRSARGTSTRWLTGAAAALVLVLAGGVALQLSSARSDDEVSNEETSTEDGAEALAATADGADSADSDRAESDSADSDAADSDLAAPPAESADEETIELDTGIDNEAPPGENVGLDQLDDLTDLADFAAAAVGAPISPDDVPAATSAAGGEEDLSEAETLLAEAELPRCLGVDIIVGPAVYRDVPVVVGIDQGRNLAIAYRADNCAEVARARLP